MTDEIINDKTGLGEPNQVLTKVKKIVAEKKIERLKSVIFLLVILLLFGVSIALAFKAQIGSENFFKWVGLAVISLVGVILLYAHKTRYESY